MERLLTQVINSVVPFVEAVGVAIIVLEVVRTMVGYVFSLLRPDPRRMNTLRLRLGQGLVMGLEFLVAADVLKTAVAPTWNAIGLLAALIGLRTVLNYLLEREVEKLAKEEIGSCLYAAQVPQPLDQQESESTEESNTAH